MQNPLNPSSEKYMIVGDSGYGTSAKSIQSSYQLD